MNHSNKSKQNFQIEDGTDPDDSQQFDAKDKQQHHPPKPIQTSFFSALDSLRSIRKKPVAKIQQADFLSHYDENFDDVFGDKPIIIPIVGEKKKEEKKDKDEGKKKKVNRRKKKQVSESEAQETESCENDNKLNQISSEKSKEKSEEGKKEQNIAKQQKQNKRPRQKPPAQQQKQMKQSSDEQLSELNKYDPKRIDLPQANAGNKKEQKNQKLKTATFNFGNEEDEKQQKQKEEKKKTQKEKPNKKQTDESGRKTRSRRVIEDDDEQIDKLFQQYQKIETKQKDGQQKRNQSQNEGKDEILTTKVDNLDDKPRLNLDQLKTNPLIPECKPQQQ